MIRPKTTTKVASAAIQEPSHRVSIVLPWWVCGSGMAPRDHSSALHADADATSNATTARLGNRRRANGRRVVRRVGLTDRLPHR
ncbi:hypothetical protein GCM10009555_024600 [Acrocarpospora macrocephala]